MFKKIGLTKEHQVGRDAFDKAIYIVSDDLHLWRALSPEEKLTSDIDEMFRLAPATFCELREIRYNSGMLWLRYKVFTGFDAQSIDKVAAKLAPKLALIAAALIKAEQDTTKKLRDPFVIRAAVLLAISSGLAINGALQLWRLDWTALPITLDVGELLRHALWLAGTVSALLIIAAIVWLGRSARTHLVLIELLVVGSLGAAATGAAELRDMNIEFDQHPPELHAVNTVLKAVARSRRSTRYYLYVEDWEGKQSQVKLKVSAAIYERIDIGKRVVIVVRPGLLSYRWIEDIRAAAAE